MMKGILFTTYIIGKFLILLLAFELASSRRRYRLTARLNDLYFDSSRFTRCRFRMTCDYELGEETLYSIQWFKDDVGFFRYLLHDVPPFKFFPSEGIDLNIEMSDNKSVCFNCLSFEGPSMFACEVSTVEDTTMRVERQLLDTHTSACMKNFYVPSNVTTGDSVRLHCEYNLGSETLYTAKWYWNDLEFFRYEPASISPITFYPYSGIDVDLSKSNNTSVYLRNLSMESSGEYSCEVSMDKPFYTTLKYTKQLEVVEKIGFSIKMIHIPHDIVIGDTVQLYCEYELANETLNTLKWLKDGIEFFRYESDSNSSSFTFYPTVGINIDMSKSDNSSVYLNNVSLSTIGNYTCEIYSDQPYFNFGNFTKELQVSVPPSDGPFLKEEKSIYVLGDDASILCISGKAKPAPQLKWYMNNESTPLKMHNQSTTTFVDGLERSRLILRFHLATNILLEGKVALKCVATYNKTDAIITKEITPVDRYIQPFIKQFHIPSPMSTNNSARLQCDYELGNFSEYTVTWKFNMEKIIKYDADKSLLFTYWPDDLIDVDISKSNSISVNIRHLSLEHSGNYTCEVSARKPYNKSVETTEKLQVFVPPAEGPFLEEETGYYKLGENVTVSCISGMAKPAPELKWYINDHLVPYDFIDQDITMYPNGLEGSRLALCFHLKPDMMTEGKVNLKCVSNFCETYAEIEKEITPIV